MAGYSVAVVGATGAVGAEFLNLFDQRNFPISELRLLASARSAGKVATFRGESIPIEEATEDAFAGVDFAFFSAGASRSRALVPAALAAGARVIDNSSAFRMDPGVPLVVPEVNPAALGSARLVAVPNCTAIILVTAIHPLRSLAPFDRLIVSTYQSASGGGAAMMEYLRADTLATLTGEARPTPPTGVPPYAFNVFSHNTAIGDDGFNEEEQKVRAETQKILGLPELRINVTCVRVPVLRAHTETVTVEFQGEAPSEEAIRAVLTAAPGVRVVDDRAANHFPTPAEASGQGDVLVGRIRRDPSHPASVNLMIAGDQLLKGAALNAVQIAEMMID